MRLLQLCGPTPGVEHTDLRPQAEASVRSSTAHTAGLISPLQLTRVGHALHHALVQWYVGTTQCWAPCRLQEVSHWDDPIGPHQGVWAPQLNVHTAVLHAKYNFDLKLSLKQQVILDD